MQGDINCLGDGIDDSFKVSNDPALVGWNPSMEPREMYNQVTTGAPHQPPPSKTIRCFRVCIPHKMSPKSLFRCIEDCQEVQILGEDPYTAQQLLKNAVYQLLQSGLYTRDFEDWD